MQTLRRILLAVLVLTIFGVVATATAYEERQGQTITIGADEVIADDLYVTADEFILDGVVQGDLFVAGRLLTINGVVEGDLFAAGQVINLNGEVQDDARLAGAVLTVGSAAQIADDVMTAGYSLALEENSSVGGTLLFAGNQSLLDGRIGEAATVTAGSLLLAGEIEGDLTANVGSSETTANFDPFIFMPETAAPPEIPAGLTVNPDATIGGNLSLAGPAPVEIPTGVVAGEVIRPEVPVGAAEETDEAGGSAVVAWLLDNLQRLLVLFLVGLLMLWLLPRLTQGTANRLATHPVPSLGWGCLGLILIPVIILLVIGVGVILALLLGLITLDGLAGTALAVGLLIAAAMTILFILLTVYGSKIIVSLLAGQKLLGAVRGDWAKARVWGLLLGLILVVVLTGIPYLGWLVNLIVVVLGLGAVLLWWQMGTGSKATELE